MGRYFCDYCDTFLTHDSEAGRQQHNRGWRHRENFRAYYKQFYPGFAAKKAHQPQMLQQQPHQAQQMMHQPSVYANVLPPSAG